VPEEGELFLQRACAFSHLIEPPAAQFNHPLALQPLFFTLHFAAIFLAGLPHGLLFGRFIGVKFGPLGVGGLVRDFLEIDEVCDGLFRSQLDEIFNLGRRPAETGAVQKMRRGSKVPFIGG
jgi:hypothetical protein